MYNPIGAKRLLSYFFYWTQPIVASQLVPANIRS